MKGKRNSKRVVSAEPKEESISKRKWTPVSDAKIATGFGKEAIGVINIEISFKCFWLKPVKVGDLNYRHLLSSLG